MPKLNYGSLPNPLSWVIQFLLVITIEDAYFYYVHRISHELKWFYEKVQKGKFTIIISMRFVESKIEKGSLSTP